MSRLLSLLLVLLAQGEASAEVVDLVLGARGSVGGNLWTAPTQVPFSEDLWFSDTRGGYGGGGGIYLEGRFVRYVALEFGAQFEQDRLWENQTFNAGLASAKQKLTTVTLNCRMPLIVKGVLPLPGIRLSLGVGPEFVLPISTRVEIEEVRGKVLLPFHIQSRRENSIMVTTDLGITVTLPYHLLLPIHLRASYNASQPKAWGDRVKHDAATNTYSIAPQNSWDFRLLIGLGYDFRW